MCLVFGTCVLFFMCISTNTASDIYGNVWDDITFSWMLNPIPSQGDIVGVSNPAGSLIFQAQGTTPIVESAYTGRIIYNGNTTAGQMRFTLNRINTTDTGLYTTRYNGNIIYPGQTLYVYGKPTRPSVTKMSAPVVNSNLQLNCSTKSTTVPDNHNLTMTYRWSINGINITSSNGRYIIYKSLITIQNINLYDGNTTVTCTGTEQGGLTSLTSIVYTVIPEYGPRTVTFTPSITSYSATELSTIPDITCSADCKPNCNYRWTKDGQVTSHGFGSALLLSNLNRNDTGVYRCTAWNDHGTKNSTNINVDVKYGPRTVTFTPSTTSYSPTELSTILDITCIADCKPNCYYRWTKDGQVTSHGSGSTLSLRNINRNDTGVYRCTAWNNHGAKSSTNINLGVEYGPGTVTFTPSITSYLPTELSTIPDITCSADCKPNCNYRWTKDGQVTSHGSGSTLLLRIINRNDTGVYRCTAWNDHGTKNSTDINADIKYGPGSSVGIMPMNTTFTYIENTTVSTQISCQADCNPECTYSWNATQNSNPLIFGKVDRSQKGKYVCTATNEVGSAEVSITLIVQYPSRVIRSSFVAIKVKESQKITLTCPIWAVPLPIAVWSKNNGTTFVTASRPSNPSLFQIDRANCVDTGNYTCTVDNHITEHSLDYRNYRLTVDCAPRLKHPQTNPVVVATSESFNISSVFIGYPLPNITWNFNDKPIENNGSIVVVRIKDYKISTYLSKDLLSKNDFGIYTVVVENKFGKANATFTVQAQRKPDTATNIIANCVSTNSANISFIPGFNGGVEQTLYIVYNNSGTAQIKQVASKDRGENTTILIQDLIAETEYVFTIISSNAFGNISSDTEGRCKTKTVDTYGSPVAVIGGVTGSISGLIVIGTVVFIILFTRRRKGTTKGNNDGLRLRPADNDGDEMRDNVLYEPAGPNYVKSHTPEAASGSNDYPYADVQSSGGKNISNGKSADLYAEVQKKTKMETNMSVDPNAIYSQVQKPKKGGAKPKTLPGKQNTESGMVYENIEMDTDAKRDKKPKPPTAKKPGKRNKDGLPYADLVFAPPGSGKAFVIHGLEDRTNYVEIDFSKKAEPLPPDNNETTVETKKKE